MPKPSRPSTKIRVNPTKRIALIAGGVVVVGIGLLIALNFDKDGGQANLDDAFIIDLMPDPLTSDEVRRTGTNPAIDGSMPVLEAGGWIQIVDTDTGRLAQQYRFQRLDPNPQGMPANWVRMDQPRCELYLSGNRVLRLSGDSALVHLPHRVLESGTLTGHVRIEVFEPPPGYLLNDLRDKPVLVMHAPEAAFDNVMGEVSCRDRFRAESPSMEFLGSGLSLLINDQPDPVRTTMEIEHLEYARLAQATVEAGSPDEPANPGSPRPAGTSRRGSPGSPGSAGSAGSAQAPSSDAPVQYYNLTLRDNVKIQEGIGTRVVTGDLLTVLFSTKSNGLTGPAARGPIRSSATDEAVARTKASVSPEGSTERSRKSRIGADTTTRHPESSHLGDRSIAPPISDTDIYVTCTGVLSLVPTDDPAERLESPRDSRMTLTGAPVVLVDRSQDARAVCDRLVYLSLQRKIMLVGSETHPLSIEAPGLAGGGERFWISQGTGGFDGPGWLTASPAEQSGTEKLTWSDGVDLEFEETSGASAAALGNLRRAVLRGDVEAHDEDSSLTCNEQLALDLQTDANGRTIPTLMTAIGDVRASDPRQTMWSHRLEVILRPTEGTTDVDEGLPVDGLGAGTSVESLTAEGDVQVLLADGVRAFADRFVGDAQQEQAELLGSNVAIATKQWIVDHGTRIMLDKASGTAQWNGPGTARMFDRELDVGADRRIELASLALDPQAVATWTGSMSYDDAGGDGAGSIHLTDNVQMISEPNDLERTTFKADDVTIELAGEPMAGGEDAAANRRSIATVTGRGNATLEQRRWVERSNEPRIFFVSGETLLFDQRTGEALVPGPGELLIRDLRPAADGDGRTDTFAARGTTGVRWTTRLQMTRQSETLFDIVMLDGIEMRHLDLEGQTSTLSCNRIDATLDRSDPAAADGPADLRHVRAKGEVFLRTPTRDVECDLFDYDVAGGRATLEAKPDRLVTIHTRGTPRPITLRSAEWNLRTDELTARSGSGGAEK